VSYGRSAQVLDGKIGMILKNMRLLFWSLRKLRLPIRFNDLVIEVGSGGNPHPASSVLAEKFVDSSHRLKEIKIDREIVLADACHMPFIDNAFDYSIAFHVLEHVPDPKLFADELSRISKAGYIETPNALYERLFPLDVHLLEVSLVDDELLILKKPQAMHDEMMALSNLVANDRRWSEVFESKPELFHVCHKWTGRIKTRILNESQSLEWHHFPESGLLPDQVDVCETGKGGTNVGLRQLIIWLIRRFHVAMSRRSFDIEKILACPKCKGSMTKTETQYHCAPCLLSYRAAPTRDFTKPIETHSR
jgi:SAM-dependent methyltransferase